MKPVQRQLKAKLIYLLSFYVNAIKGFYVETPERPKSINISFQFSIFQTSQSLFLSLSLPTEKSRKLDKMFL